VLSAEQIGESVAVEQWPNNEFSEPRAETKSHLARPSLCAACKKDHLSAEAKSKVLSS
jgi:hypothetical protein